MKSEINDRVNIIPELDLIYAKITKAILSYNYWYDDKLRYPNFNPSKPLTQLVLEESFRELQDDIDILRQYKIKTILPETNPMYPIILDEIRFLKEKKDYAIIILGNILSIIQQLFNRLNGFTSDYHANGGRYTGVAPMAAAKQIQSQGGKSKQKKKPTQWKVTTKTFKTKDGITRKVYSDGKGNTAIKRKVGDRFVYKKI